MCYGDPQYVKRSALKSRIEIFIFQNFPAQRWVAIFKKSPFLIFSSLLLPIIWKWYYFECGRVQEGTGGYGRVREGTGGYGRVREGTGRKILPCSGLAFWPRSGPLRELLVKTYSKAPYKQLQKVFNNLSLHYLQQVFCFIFVFSLCLTKINYKFSRPLTFCTIKRIKFP